MGGRHGTDKYNDNPGVGTYNIDKRDRRGITMSFRHKNPDLDPRSPGPARYTPNYFVAAKSAPAFSMKSRHSGPDLALLPGPGQYNPLYRPKT